MVYAPNMGNNLSDSETTYASHKFIKFSPRFSCMVQAVVHLDARYDDLDFQCSEHSLNEPNSVVWGGFVGIDGA